MKKNIVLIGFMGTGKSTVGKILAHKIAYEFIDTDREIERVTGLTITQIFDNHGEQRFRSEETVMARKVSEKTKKVISTGGGIVLRQENVTALRSTGIIIELSARPEIIWQRISRRTHRPLIRKEMDAQVIAEMMAQREPYYQCADYRIDTSEKTLVQVVEEIAQILHQREQEEGESWLAEMNSLPKRLEKEESRRNHRSLILHHLSQRRNCRRKGSIGEA
ncbi:shikimate kinase [Heliorestis acidaminivorans]|uniref:Shikimate kinase n=1 Tax=Heliorestis acidaminivorans TaxID=553427 RepID=A0A6I0EZV7_9FIRM|nr:shikimate kinase [Heliorestis acidaminivorans]KAB2951304.1 shikimate kinase [Heliorestis acidaminivorans]